MPSKKQNVDSKAEAARWLQKYGEPIDSPELRRVASLAAVERERSAVSALRVLGEYAKLLRRQRQEQIAFLEHRTPGEKGTLGQRLENELAVAGERGERGRRARVSSYVALLEGRVGRTKRGTPRRSVLGLARHAHPGELLLALRLTQRSGASRADELVADLLRRTPEWRWKAKTRGADVALAVACYEVSEWIRKRHPNKSGHLDGRTSWPDVVRCLQWYGHDLSQIAGSKADALRRLADRIRAKRTAADKVAAKATKKAKKKLKK